jgi:hypothetical protein
MAGTREEYGTEILLSSTDYCPELQLQTPSAWWRLFGGKEKGS